MKLAIALLIVIIILSFNVLSQENLYVLQIERQNGELIISNLEIAEGPGEDYLDQPEIGYTAKMLSFKNEELFSYKFEAMEKLTIENPSDSNVTAPAFKGFNPEEEPIILQFPYYNNAKKIEILDETGKLKLEIDLSSYARCNENDFCDFNEDLQRCPEDCREEIARPEAKADEAKKEEAIEEIPAAIEEPKEETLLEQLEAKGISRNLMIIIAALALILIIIIILARKKKE